MVKTLVLFFLLLTVLNGFADTQESNKIFDGLLPEFSLATIEKGLQEVLDSGHLIPLDYPIEEEKPLGAPLDAPFRSAFQNVTRVLDEIGGHFSMEAHQLREGMAYCDVKKMVIRIDPDQFSILYDSTPFNRKELILGLEFIIAHEISHYLQLLYVEKVSNNKKTPSELGFDDYSPIESESASANPHDIIRGFLIAGGRKIYELHAEVDLFALAILKKMDRSEGEIRKAIEVAQHAFFASKDSKKIDLDTVSLEDLQIAFEALEGNFRLKTINKTLRESYKKK